MLIKVVFISLIGWLKLKSFISKLKDSKLFGLILYKNRDLYMVHKDHFKIHFLIASKEIIILPRKIFTGNGLITAHCIFKMLIVIIIIIIIILLFLLLLNFTYYSIYMPVFTTYTVFLETRL